MATEDTPFFRVITSTSLCKYCTHGDLYSVAYTDEEGEEVHIGSELADRERADDLCELMNTAFLAGAAAEARRLALRMHAASNLPLGTEPQS